MTESIEPQASEPTESTESTDAAPPPAPPGALREYIEQETATNQKSAKFGIIMFAILAIFVFGYFMVLRHMMKEIVQPRNLAMAMVTTIDAQLPTATQALEDNIKTALPNMVKNTMDTVVERSIPQMGQYGERYLDENSAALADFTSNVGDEVFVKIVSQSAADYRKQKPEGMETDKAQVVAHLKKSIGDKLSTGFDTKMAEELKAAEEGKGGEETAAVKLHKSRKALDNINTKLEKLASGENLTRKDQVHRRILGAWWGYMKKSQTANASEPEKPEQEEEPSN